MSLSIGKVLRRSKDVDYIREDLHYWDGQMKHIAWLEKNNEDCDSHYCSFDMEPHD